MLLNLEQVAYNIWKYILPATFWSIEFLSKYQKATEY